MTTEAGKLLEQALDRVKRPPENEYWDCLIWAHKWVLRQPHGAEFTSGDVSAGYPGDPVEGRVWGAVMSQLRRDEIIASTKPRRYERHPSATRHCAPALVWVKIRR